MKKKWIILSLVTVLLGGGGYGTYKYMSSGEEAVDPAMGEAPSFPTAMADVGEVKKTIYATGTVEAKEREEIKAELGGKVEQLLVKEGQKVKAGDVLFTIDTSDAALELRKQDLALARVQKDMDELKKRKPTIHANRAGKVKTVSIKEGDEVTPDTVVAKVINTEYLKISGRFSTYEAEHFRVGMKVKVFLPSSLSYIEGTVSKVDLFGSVQSDGDKKTDSNNSEEKPVGSKSVTFKAPQNVEVMVKKPGALFAGDQGVIQYIDEKGALYSSTAPAPFSLPDEIEIYAGTSGKVKRVAIGEDDIVTDGQLVAEMDTSNNELEHREKELSLLEAQLTMAQKQKEVAKNRVIAPIDGEVTKLEIKAGDTIDTGKVAMVLMDTSAFTFQAAVDELDIPAIKLGQTADVYVTAFGDQPFKGKVISIPTEGTKNEKNVSFTVEVAMENNGKLSHGMTGDCDINISNKANVTRLPAQAVEVLEAGKGNVMVKDPASGEPTPKEVEIGVEGSEFVEIIKGVAPGEEVLLMNG